jgi:hypothetical protein
MLITGHGYFYYDKQFSIAHIHEILAEINNKQKFYELNKRAANLHCIIQGAR